MTAAVLAAVVLRLLSTPSVSSGPGVRITSRTVSHSPSRSSMPKRDEEEDDATVPLRRDPSAPPSIFTTTTPDARPVKSKVRLYYSAL